MLSQKILSIFLIFTLPSYIISAPSSHSKCPKLGANEPLIKYNVLLKTSSANYDSVVKNHFEMLQECLQKEKINVHKFDFSSVKDTKNDNAIFDFSVNGMIAGYTTTFTKSFVVDYLSKLDDVELVEADGVIKNAFDIGISNSTGFERRAERDATNIPNLDRIDQEKYPLDNKYKYPDSAGTGVDIYVLDTGIYLDHEEFQGRGGTTLVEKSFCDEITDDDGHGTNVASIIAGKTYGVANKANLIGIKIAGKTCPITSQNIINGITYVMQHKKDNPDKKIVINLSAVNRNGDEALKTVARQAVAAGIHFIAGAGNDNRDACLYAPGAVETVITVAATKITIPPNRQDWATEFTNWGKCVTIFAPGVDIQAAGIGSTSEIVKTVGTSVAAPHVTGAMALILADGDLDYDPEQAKAKLLSYATKDQIKGLDYRPTANLLLRVPPIN
ncbi:9985_t:CDS:2 [Funneliformis caledonium]|uniref:9985_t:CDS:1 n=1 Tax=Funneliformis caledonium TaxID=1117310 RepID=A0A9N9ENS6_9GLOM|nr:9985_t:CDS:2 [Funneliformis caledonium]